MRTLAISIFASATLLGGVAAWGVSEYRADSYRDQRIARERLKMERGDVQSKAFRECVALVAAHDGNRFMCDQLIATK